MESFQQICWQDYVSSGIEFGFMHKRECVYVPVLLSSKINVTSMINVLKKKKTVGVSNFYFYVSEK